MIRTFTELDQLSGYEARFRYLALRGRVGEETFGRERELNQTFYRSREWKQLRYYVIARDLGCDLGVEGYEVHDQILIHHMNPITVDEVVHRDSSILDPEFLISTSLRTHNGIHYGDERSLPRQFVERTPGDTNLW